MIRPAAPSGRARRHAADGDGGLEVFVTDDQHDHLVDIGRWETLSRDVLVAEGIRGDAELAVAFVDEAAMAELNATFMGAEGATDVLAFPLDASDDPIAGRSPDDSTSGHHREPPTDQPLLLGDIVICPAVAARNAPTHAGTYVDEMALLVVHGILHVLGADHATRAETEAMQARERDLLGRFHRSEP